MKDYFNDKSQDIKKNNKNVKIPGVFDIKKGEYIITFNGISSLQQVDLCALASTGDFDPEIIYQLGDVVASNDDYFTLFQLVDDDGNEYEGQAPYDPAGTPFKILGITGEGEYKDVFEPGEQDSASDITGYMNALHSDLETLITNFESADDAGSSGETVTNKKPKKTSKFLILEKEEWLNSNVPDNSGNTEPPALKGSYIEIYRPSKSANDEDVIFYEFGELFDIGLDANGNRVHLGLNNLHQTFDSFGQLLTPAQGVFRNGDTYTRIRLAHHNNVDGTFIESFHHLIVTGKLSKV